jgi:HPt (histidine-containing phosphotransfer) domain-containing protein
MQGSKTLSPTTFDRASSMETVLGNQDLFKEIAVICIKDCADYTAKIKEGISKRDTVVVERASHSLKDAVSTFGAQNAQAFAYHLEKLGSERNLEAAVDELSNLEIALNEFISEMKNVLQEMTK